MKRFILSIILFAMPGLAFADITINNMSALTMTIYKQGTSSYSDASPGWALLGNIKFVVSATPGGNASLSFPSSVTLTRSGGSETVTVGLVCRQWSTWATTKNDGVPCTSVYTLNDTSTKYITLFPVSAVFSSSAGGSYIGTVPVDLNYL